MWQKLRPGARRERRRHMFLALVSLGLLSFLLISCGSANSGGTATSAPASLEQKVAGSNQSQGQAVPSSGRSSSGNSGNSGSQGGPRYLVKSLQVTMEVPHPLQSASDLQQWIAFTDPQSTSDGNDYENMGNGQYTVTLTFLVDVAHYTQVEAYLRDYAGQKGRTLDRLQESVEDVTNDYIDTQSTLSNLRAEQQRLLGFMSQAQNVNEAVNVEQQLAQVEGQIDQIEAHLDALKGQTSFYPITVTIQPVGSVPPPPGPWSAVPIWQAAWGGVIAVWQALIAVLIWLLAFSIYIVPAGILIWLLRLKPWRKRTLPPLKASLSLAGYPGTSEPQDGPSPRPASVELPPEPSEGEYISHP